MNVEIIDHMGSDLSVVNAARVSFDKESEWEVGPYGDLPGGLLSAKDAKLISYLAKHNHWTPFAHTCLSFRIKAPIFVARQLGKHQVGLVWNEVSRRYVDSEPEFYIPETWRKRADNVKQGSSKEAVTFVGTRPWTFTEAVEYATLKCREAYLEMLEGGVCPEQARMVLPQSMMTEWVWTGSLAAFARVCKARLDPHTQRETQEIAKMIDAEARKLFPVSWDALNRDAPSDEIENAFAVLSKEK